MREKNNKGFWDRWAKRYDFAMSGNGRIYAQIVESYEEGAEQGDDRTGACLRDGAFVSADCGKREAGGGDGFFGRDDTAGKGESAQFPPPFLRAGCHKPSLYIGNL